MIKEFKFGWVDLSDIPIKNKRFNWQDSMHKYINFKYDTLEDRFEVLNYKKETQHLSLLFRDEIIVLGTGELTNGKFYKLIKKHFTYNKFKLEIGFHVKDEKRDLTIIDRKVEQNEVFDKRANKVYVEQEEHYKYHCNICQNENWIRYNKLKHAQQGCNVCGHCAVKEGYNDIPTTAPWMIPYFQGGYNEAKLYTCQSKQTICPICPDCGAIKNTPVTISTIYNSRNIGCACSDNVSYPNKFAYAFLKQLPAYNIIREWSPKWLKPYKFDNYFEYNNQKYVLEMDGGLGHGNRTWDNTLDTVGLQKDKIKEKLAKQHDVVVIRVDSIKSDQEYIKNNIINSVLNDIFDLSNIDWDSCEYFTMTNLKKEICLYFHNNNHLSYKKIGTIFNVGSNTVSRYVKLGIKFGWCKSPDEYKLIKIKNLCEDYMNNNYSYKKLSQKFHISKETVKTYLLIGEQQGFCTLKKTPSYIYQLENIQIDVFHRVVIDIYNIDEEYVLTYSGIGELCRQSEKLLGIKLCKNHVSNSLKTGSPYKGFYFKLKEK